jgi:hypothetical protein
MSAESNELELEAALERAAAEPAYRPEFYQKLLDANAYILAGSDVLPEGEHVLKSSARISIVNWEKEDGSKVIPFFSSLQKLQSAIQTEQSYYRMPVRALFETTKGSNLILNPRSPYGKEFFPNEIAALLSSGVNQVSDKRIVKEPTSVLLGQPQNYPTEMVASLVTFLSKHENVRAAYLALMETADTGGKPTLVVGIEGDGDLEDVIMQAGVVAADSPKETEFVDLIRVDRAEQGISKYLIESTTPFYTR